MTIDELRNKQIAYSKALPAIRKQLKVLEANRQQFVHRYAIDNLQNLPI